MGHESLAPLLSESSDRVRFTAGAAWLADGTIAVLSSFGVVEVIDARGRIHRLAPLPGSPDNDAPSLSVESAGTLLVVWQGRVWRIDGRRQVAPLTPRRFDVRGVGALPDGGFLFTRGHQVFRSLPDGRTEAVAGAGRRGHGRAGPALRSRLEHPEVVVALPAGGFAFSDSGRVVWAVDATGEMRRLAGGGRAHTISPAGRPALSVALDFITGIRALPDGQVVLSSLDKGVLVVAQGRIREFVHAADLLSVPPGFPPLWSGLSARRAWALASGAVDRNAAGEWLIPTGTGIAMITNGDWAASRLAVALSPATLHSVWHRRLELTATAPATARIRARVRGRVVATIRGRLRAGRTRLRLPRHLPAGVVDLDVRAVGADGAVASDTLRLLGRRRLPVAVARRSLLTDLDLRRELADNVTRCTRRSTTRVDCTVVGSDFEGSALSLRARVRLRLDGWLQTTEAHLRTRIELV